jgi:hypothetical protein
MWKNRLTACLRPVLSLFVLAGLLSLAACGGGNGAPNNPYAGGGGVLSVFPASTIVYSGVPSTLTISGGTGPFQVFSSDSAVLPVAYAGSTTIPLLANTVAADTPVTITIRDANGTTVAAAVTVKPSSLLPASITITGNPVCSGSGSTLCSGQDGTASVQLTGAAGTPLAGRQVRFDVVLGTFSLVTANSTVPAQTVTVLSDHNGLAVVTIRVPTTALTQFATSRATDVASGSTVIGQFTIAQFVDGSSVLSVIPTGVTTFTGPDSATCSSGAQANFYIFGGTPPDNVANNYPPADEVVVLPVLTSRGRVPSAEDGPCFDGLTFAITDAAGRTLLTPPTASNVKGTGAPPPTPVVITPSEFGTSGSPVACTMNTANLVTFLASGGTGSYQVAAVGGTGGPLNVPATSTGAIVVSVGTSDAHGDWKINVSSGGAPTTATVHCS